MDRFDALVIGGGPSGSTTAHLLAAAGWQVALVERRAFPRAKVCGEYLSATNLPLLDHLGAGAAFRECAGPAVHTVGMFSGPAVFTAPLPWPDGAQPDWGRALSRERLDGLLVERAQAAGAVLFQPCSVVELAETGAAYCCRVAGRDGPPRVLGAPVVVAAHGSWENGWLPTQGRRRPARPGDLFGFKARFAAGRLEPGLMPLLAFPDGYGGMVHDECNRVSLSCCIRRDRLQSLRGSGGVAGDAVLAHLLRHCRGAREALGGAARDGPWLAAGPIRPGTRRLARGGLFCVGNAAGEAHPAIAEGISMALQSAWLLARELVAWKRAGGRGGELAGVGDRYQRAWRRLFALRIRVSALVAHWAMSPLAQALARPLLRLFPALLTWGARWAGKALPCDLTPGPEGVP